MIDAYKDEEGHIKKKDILKIIPYSEQFLMIDEVLSIDEKKIVASKKIRQGEYFLEGHFVGYAIVPGVVMVEGFGQTATILARCMTEDHEQKDVLLYKIKDAAFFEPAYPGQEIVYEVSLMSQEKNKMTMHALVNADGKKIGEGTIVLAVVDKAKFRVRK